MLRTPKPLLPTLEFSVMAVSVSNLPAGLLCGVNTATNRTIPSYLLETYGKPFDWVPRHQRLSDKKSSSPSSKLDSPSDVVFSKAQLDQLGKLLCTTLVSPSSSLMAHGISAPSPSDNSPQGEPWIRAPPTICPGQSLFLSTFAPYSGPKFVFLADGSLSTVVTVGSVQFSDTLTLYNVFYVPNLSHNLLSISKITVDSNCIVNFSPYSCLFQDWCLGTTIGDWCWVGYITLSIMLLLLEVAFRFLLLLPITNKFSFSIVALVTLVSPYLMFISKFVSFLEFFHLSSLYSHQTKAISLSCSFLFRVGPLRLNS